MCRKARRARRAGNARQGAGLFGLSCWPGRANQPDEPKRPDRPSLSSGWLGLCGIRDFGLGLKRDEFGLGCDTPDVEEDGDQHVAQDVDA